MARRRQLYESQAKILFEGPEPGTLVQHFKDDTVSFDGKTTEAITGKGVLNNRISEFLMTRLGEVGITNHFVRRINMREQLILDVDSIPLVLTVRNIASGRFAERFAIAEGTRLPRSIIEYYFKNNTAEFPMVSEEHITCFGWANTADIDDMVALALRANDFLSGLFLGVGITLADFQVEFGRLWSNDDMRIILSDEVSPDRCTLWDTKRVEQNPKDGFRHELGRSAEGYQEVARRLGVLAEGRG
jgi:phosphoribosylaminoimidazole-succinocarboxamide synthase